MYTITTVTTYGFTVYKFRMYLRVEYVLSMYWEAVGLLCTEYCYDLRDVYPDRR